MKKHLLIPFILLLCTAAAHAQVSPSFKLGVKGGLNFTKLISEDKLFNSNNGAGYFAGGWARLGFGGFHIQPEVYYTTKNSTKKNENTTESDEVQLSSIDVPILLGTKFGIGPIGTRLQVGPLFSFNQLDDAKPVTTEYKKNAAAVVGGLGFDISKLTVDVRYEHGIGNITKETDKQTLNLWTIGLGFSFF